MNEFDFDLLAPPQDFSSAGSIKMLEDGLLDDSSINIKQPETGIEAALTLGLRSGLDFVSNTNSDKDTQRLAKRLSGLVKDSDDFAGIADSPYVAGEVESYALDNTLVTRFDTSRIEGKTEDQVQSTLVHESIHNVLGSRLMDSRVYKNATSRGKLGIEDNTTTDALKDLSKAHNLYQQHINDKYFSTGKVSEMKDYEDIAFRDFEEFIIRSVSEPRLLKDLEGIQDNRATLELRKITGDDGFIKNISHLMGFGEPLPKVNLKETSSHYMNRLLDSLEDRDAEGSTLRSINNKVDEVNGR